MSTDNIWGSKNIHRDLRGFWKLLCRSKENPKSLRAVGRYAALTLVGTLTYPHRGWVGLGGWGNRHEFGVSNSKNYFPSLPLSLSICPQFSPAYVPPPVCTPWPLPAGPPAPPSPPPLYLWLAFLPLSLRISESLHPSVGFQQFCLLLPVCFPGLPYLPSLLSLPISALPPSLPQPVSGGLHPSCVSACLSSLCQPGSFFVYLHLCPICWVLSLSLHPSLHPLSCILPPPLHPSS